MVLKNEEFFDEFHFTDTEDEEETDPALEKGRAHLVQGFEIAQARPLLTRIVSLSSVFPWIWNTRSWFVYASIGPWRLLIRWKFGLQELYQYELALGSTTEKDMSADSKVSFCSYHHRRQKAKVFCVNDALLFADVPSGAGHVRLQNKGCVAAMTTQQPSCAANERSFIPMNPINCMTDPSFVPLYLYELE